MLNPIRVQIIIDPSSQQNLRHRRYQPLPSSSPTHTLLRSGFTSLDNWTMSTLGDTKSKDLGLSGAMSESGDDDANLLANCEATGVLRVNLAGDQLVWLKWMKDKYFLFSIDQALACLIDYSMAADEATQKFIFTVIRCRRCGRRFEKKAVDLALVPELDGSINRSEGSTSKKTDASNNGGTPEYVFDKRARDLIVKHFGADVSKDNCNPVGGNTAGAGEEAPELTQGEPENNNEEKADVDSDAEATDPWLKKSLALRKRRLQFILSAQKEYDIPSIGKVIRILLDYAQQVSLVHYMDHSDPYSLIYKRHGWSLLAWLLYICIPLFLLLSTVLPVKWLLQF